MPTDLTSRDDTASADTNLVRGSRVGICLVRPGSWATCSSHGVPVSTQSSSVDPALTPRRRIMYFVITFTLFGVAAVAGTGCYQNWKRLTGLAKLSQAEGREREEFMALAGMFMSLTLGVGIVWLCIPLFILQMCIRAR